MEVKIMGSRERPLHYRDRQLEATNWGADVFVSQHLDAADRGGTNFPLVLLARDFPADDLVVTMANRYLDLCDLLLVPRGEPGRIERVVQGQRGHFQIALHPRALLLEPLFLFDRHQARWLAHDGWRTLGWMLAKTIEDVFGRDIRVALSPGHAFKVNSRDRGTRMAAVGLTHDDSGEPLTILPGNIDFFTLRQFRNTWEADWNIAIVDYAASLMMRTPTPHNGRHLVMMDERPLRSIERSSEPTRRDPETSADPLYRYRDGEPGEPNG